MISSVALAEGRRTGVKIPLGKTIQKDSMGFDDIADFWDASGRFLFVFP